MVQKWKYDLGYIRSPQPLIQMLCVFYNEIVIRCFFLEEKSLWCTVKFLYHSQGKRMTNAAMLYFVFMCWSDTG